MRYMVNPCSHLKVTFNSKAEALAYAKELFKKGEELPFGGYFYPQKEGYTKPEQLVDAIPEYLGEEEED